MKSGMGVLLFIAMIFFAFGGLFTWFALYGDWVNYNMPYDFQTVTRWEVVIALWGAIGVVLFGGYQGAKDSGWEMPSYETFDGRIPPISTIQPHTRSTAPSEQEPLHESARPSAGRRPRSRTRENRSSSESSQVLETENASGREFRGPDERDYRGEMPTRKRRGFDY